MQEKLEKNNLQTWDGGYEKLKFSKNRQKSDKANKNCHFGMPHKKHMHRRIYITPQRN